MQFSYSNLYMKGQTDADLLDSYRRSGNQDILGELYSRQMHLVYGVCLKYFKSPEKSKDVVIDIYLKIQADIYKHPINNFKSWLYVVTKNHCLMELRKKKQGNELSVSSDKEMDFFMEKAGRLHPIDEEQNMRLEKALAACIKRLKEEQQKCIQMFYYENRCYREIAETLEIDEKHVKSYIQNGKRNLKICLEGRK